MNKYLLVDGSSMLVTNYYGNLPKEFFFEKDKEKQKQYYDKILHDSKGRYTNGIYGTLKQLFKIIKQQRPTHIAIAFDKTRNTFRRELYADYKGTRAETPEPLKQQFANLENLFKEMGFVSLWDDKWEADDIVGTLVKNIEEKERLASGNDEYSQSIAPIYIVTKDHDYLQLVDDYTKLWLIQTKQELADALMDKHYFFECSLLDKNDFVLPDKAFLVTPQVCFNEYGVWPWQIPDLKGIQGDTSDNIPGIKGVSSAAPALIKEYGSLENIVEAVQETNGDKKLEKELNDFWKNELSISRSPLNAIKSYGDIGLLSKKLAIIKTDCELTTTIDDMLFKPNMDKINACLEDYEMKSLVNPF